MTGMHRFEFSLFRATQGAALAANRSTGSHGWSGKDFPETSVELTNQGEQTGQITLADYMFHNSAYATSAYRQGRFHFQVRYTNDFNGLTLGILACHDALNIPPPRSRPLATVHRVQDSSH